MEQIVVGCVDCSLCYNDEGQYFCNHPNNKEPYFCLDETDDKIPITPDDCPLNSEPITIIKK